MARARRENELDYLFPQGRMDDCYYWQTENAYFAYPGSIGSSGGLGEDAGETIVMTDGSEITRAAPAATSKPWYETLVQSLVPAAASVVAARELNKLNTQRIQAGLPMLTAQQYSAQYQPPTATVAVGPSAAAMQLVKYGGIALGAYVALRALRIIR